MKLFDQHGDTIDLLLTDLRMPYMGGAELVRAPPRPPADAEADMRLGISRGGGHGIDVGFLVKAVLSRGSPVESPGSARQIAPGTMVGFFLLLLSLVLQSQAGPRTPPPADKDDTDAFTVGVLRRDGIVSPFAAFDGRHWTAPWPSDLSSVELPIGIAERSAEVVGEVGRASHRDDRHGWTARTAAGSHLDRVRPSFR